MSKKYPVLIKKGAITELANYLKKHQTGKKYAIITDDKVEKLFATKLQNKLKRAGIKSEVLSFKKGEKSKVMATVEDLANRMVDAGFTRQDAVISLGGGVVGDLAGFLASIYMRGIPYIQVPTTLLAMVDSAIGGKTGVDLESGKNLLGTITQPKAVFMDLDFLSKLPQNQIRNGMGEVIKYGVIKDKRLFKFIEQNVEKILTLEPKAIEHIVKKSVAIKLKVVRKDEHEKGQRMILNYGHTYGHAIEKMSGYSLLHGYAISIGMVIINKIAVQKGYLKEEDAQRIKALFKAFQLPTTTLKKPTNKDIQSDKKRQGKYINLVIPTKIGKAIIHQEKCQ